MMARKLRYVYVEWEGSVWRLPRKALITYLRAQTETADEEYDQVPLDPRQVEGCFMERHLSRRLARDGMSAWAAGQWADELEGGS